MEIRETGTSTIVGGDFNARTGMEVAGIEEMAGKEEERKEGCRRRSKDKRIDKERRKLISFIEEKGWEIYNGNMKEDEEGEYTFIGKGNTVIDYVIGSWESRDKIEELTIGRKVDSDHLPIEIRLKGKEEWREKKGIRRKCWRSVWDEEECQEFEKRMRRVEERRGNMEEEWEELEGEIKETLKGIEEGKGSRKRERKGWRM